MKRHFTLILSSFLFLYSHSQSKPDLANARDWIFSIALAPCKETTHINFNKIVVEDLRYDTTKLGYVKNEGTKKIVMKNGISNALTNALNIRFRNNLDSNSHRVLVIVLRHLWLQKGSDDLYADDRKIEINDNNGDAMNYSRTEAKGGINFSDFEIYCEENGTYKAITKINDEFTGVKYKAKKIDDLLFLSFDSVFRKIGKMNVDEILKSKKEYTGDFIRNAYLKRFDMPVLQASCVLKRGVFLTFDDFRNNKVSYPSFELKNGELSDQVYTGQGVNDKLLTDFWGFCDGAKLFIRIGYSCFELIRQNNTFDLYGAKKVSIETNRYYGSSPIRGARLQTVTRSMNYQPLQVDMEEGDVY